MGDRTIHVLVVEDNQGDADYLRIHLRKSDTKFDVEVAGWLSTALTVMDHRPVDVVLLDLSLPDSHGIDTVVRLRENHPKTPVIVMTGHDDMEMAIQCVRYDAQDYLIKGEITARHLERSILQAVQRQKIRRNSKRLYRLSLEQFTATDDQTTVALLRGYVERLFEYQKDLMEYLRKNAPGHMESVELIGEKHDIYSVMHDLVSTIEESTGAEEAGKPDPPRAVGEEARKTLTDLRVHADPSDEAGAREAVVDALEALGVVGG